MKTQGRHTASISIATSHNDDEAIPVVSSFEYTDETRADPDTFGILAGITAMLAAERFMRSEMMNRRMQFATTGVVRKLKTSERLIGNRDNLVVRSCQSMMALAQNEEEQRVIQIMCNFLLKKPFALERQHLKPR